MALWRFVDNSRKVGMVNGKHRDLRKKGVGCPMPLAYIQLAERFGGYPWDLEEAPADKLLFYTGVMGLEAEYRGYLADVGPDEQFYMDEEEL